MDFTTLPIIGPLVQLGAVGLHRFIDLLEPLVGSGAAALAVVLITHAVRILLIPLDIRLVRAEGARRRLAPPLAELRRRWKKRPEELQRRTMQLYKNSGVSPVAGFGSMLAQAPIVSVLYLVLASPAINGDPNPLRTETLLGVGFGEPLGAALFTGTPGAFALVAIITVVLVGAGMLLRASMRKLQRGVPQAELPPAMTSLMGILPFVTIIPALIVPFGAAIYLAVSSLWSAIERPVLRRMLWTDTEWRPE
ncbi:YidC/Oxa1 family membrane protein insertase [Microcella sp.]|uniref:YidC/Oxa1 family membrane protein insertase n=1 Tax=Microcella sp. TaxID=1913979 RepID=UPI002569A04E|nr:membrane protein insertase YidC [Microcella sp.]MBX9472983.1 YidC/Oxa1 family membrane protein insertase [Microcella sp.]